MTCKYNIAKFTSVVNKNKLLLVFALLNYGILNKAGAQDFYQPYSYQFYQKLNIDAYSISSREHTSLKPYFLGDSVLKHRYDSLMNYRDGNQNGFLNNRLFNEHLIDIKKTGSTFYADLLPDFEIGKDFANSKTTSLTSMGFQIGGSLGSNWFYNVSGYASSSVLPGYLNTYVNQLGIIPGQAYDRTLGQNIPQWDYLTATVSFTPNKYLNISAGRDKTFIGDGYRSLLLSDYASPYPFFKLTGTLGDVTYMTMWGYMNDPATTSQYHTNQHKFGVFHYLDWTVSNRLSIGFFDNVIGYFKTGNGSNRPFDFYYLNPVIFLKPVNNSSDDPDKSLIGITSKYKISNSITAYGQFALDEFRASDFFSSDGSYHNKYAWQLGLRGIDLFGISNLNYLLETNNAKPYTYSARIAIESYSENGEPLAHPWGANFREFVGLLNYSYKRFDFSGEADFGRYGLDMNGKNYGKNVFMLWPFPANYNGNYTGQGLTTDMIYLEGKVAYLLNPRYNLRLEIGGLIRDEKNSAFNDKTAMLTIGLRSSFRQLYTDVASYKPH
jgi:hypothetical protein